MNTLGIYLHIPFCISKCPYCDFYSLPYQEKMVQNYCSALKKAIRTSPAKGQSVDSIYFGGGTPVLLGTRLIELLQEVQARFSLTPDCEVTLEANPAAMTLDTLTILKKGGFNRISMGVQSASDRELSYLGRRHSFLQAVESVQMAKIAGFKNISVDLMLGTPQQNEQSINQFIQTFFEAGVQHISGYLLKIEKGTPFAKQHMEKLCPDEDASADLYLYTVEQMEKHGFLQYEVSNFSIPGFESRHNLKYWRCEEYLGIGPAAHSFYEGERFYFPRDLNAFVQAEDIWSLKEQDGKGGDIFEYLMLRLRLKEGVNLSQIKKLFGVEIDELLQCAKKLQKHGLVCVDGEHIFLTPKGFLVSNSVIVELLECL